MGVNLDRNKKITAEWSTTLWHEEGNRIVLEKLQKYTFSHRRWPTGTGVYIRDDDSCTYVKKPKIADEDNFITTIKILQWTVTDD